MPKRFGPVHSHSSANVREARTTRALLEERVDHRTQALADTADRLKENEETFRLLVQSVTDYAIFMLDPDGHVANWNPGAERIKGYTRAEIVGEHFSCFYTEEARLAGIPDQRIEQTIADVNVSSHTFHFVYPERTDSLKIPNACNVCHTDKSTAWAADALTDWKDRSPWRIAD